MPLIIRELHPASSPAFLNEEWLLVENTGPAQLNTAGCTLSVTVKGKRAHGLGSLDPGFLIKPGEKVRLVTGSPAKKGQGTPPQEEEGVRNYHLFLREPVLQQDGAKLHLFLKQHELCSAVYAPGSPGGVASATA